MLKYRSKSSVTAKKLSHYQDICKEHALCDMTFNLKTSYSIAFFLINNFYIYVLSSHSMLCGKSIHYSSYNNHTIIVAICLVLCFIPHHGKDPVFNPL